MIFKLHPNELAERATQEINLYAPGALVYSQGKTEEMIANCDVLITRFSSVVYVGLALGKEVYSDFDLEMLKSLKPIQNDGTSAQNIAQVGEELIETEKSKEPVYFEKSMIKKFRFVERIREKRKYANAKS